MVPSMTSRESSNQAGASDMSMTSLASHGHRNCARATEHTYFRDKEVWTLRKIDEELRRTGKPPITVRWVEVNKGDDFNPKIRSR